ncbi:MAG: twin-arginine translocation signal domain-containing protein, partial [Thermomicrobiales bacterium]
MSPQPASSTAHHANQLTIVGHKGVVSVSNEHNRADGIRLTQLNRRTLLKGLAASAGAGGGGGAERGGGANPTPPPQHKTKKQNTPSP